VLVYFFSLHIIIFAFSAYGNIKTPTYLGSGGGGSANDTWGWGGGKVFINVSSLELNGEIHADGGDGTY
jgi:hypothetical protein